MTKRILCNIAVAAFILAGFFAPSALALTGPNGIPAPTGTNPETTQAWKAGDKYHIIFTASTKTNATSNAIADYDAFVNAAAANSTIDGVPEATWYALASTPTVDARDRPPLNDAGDPPIYNLRVYEFSTSSPYTMLGPTNLQKLADNEVDLWNGLPNFASRIDGLDFDESGNLVRDAPSGESRVWTGSNSNGTKDNGKELGNGTVNPRYGQSNTGGTDWFRKGDNQADTSQFHIYAISEELEIQAPPLSMGAASVESITTDGADLVGTVDTGSITSWGSFWGTNTVDITNETVNTGSESAPFTFTNTIASGMPVGTQVHYYAWASNAADGLKVSTTNNFYTEPLQVSGLTFTETNDNDVTFSWTKGTAGAKTLVIVRQDDAVSSDPDDGTTYTANASFTGGGTALGGGKVVYADSGTEVTVTELTASTTYHVALYAYAGSGSPINYQQDSAVTGNAETTGTAPVLGITNAVTPVAHGTSSTTIGGTNNVEVVGTLTWSNAATTATGTMNAGTGPDYSWISGSITLEYGDNEITVTGTNAAGTEASDSVTITRNNPPAPLVTVTTADDSVADTVDAYDIAGTSENTVGTMSWTNAANASNGTFAAAANWNVDDIPLDYGDNVITVTGVNVADVEASDSVTITRANVIVPIVTPTGTNPETGEAWKAGDKYYLMFLTSTKTDATSTDIGDYDAVVNAAADTSTIDGVPERTWYALASTATVDARDRGDLGGGVQTHPVYMMEDLVEGDPGSSVNLRKVFDNESDMWDGSNDGSSESQLVYPYSYGHMDYDESGVGVRSASAPDGERVWTGTQNNGTEYSSGGLGTATPRQGQCNTGDEKWIQRFDRSNTDSYHLYAISEELTVPAPPLSMGAASVESITTDGADLIGTVDTGSITSWGSFWGTNTVDITNETVNTGSESAPFTFTNTIASGMPVGAQVYYYAWASNAADGLVVSTTNNFYTEPLQISGLSFDTINDNDVTLSWTKNTAGSETLVIVKEDSAVSGDPVDGTTYTADTDFTGSGTALGGGKVVYADSGTEVTVTELTASTTYYVALYAYAGSGSPINYQQDGAVTGDDTTTGTAPVLGITNAVTPVAHDTSSTTIGGTNNVEVVGTLTWSNAATTVTGTMDAGTGPDYSWVSGSIALEFGANEITVTGTNDVGTPASDSVTITRTDPPLAYVDITDPAGDTDAGEATSYTVSGTNNANTVGLLAWANSLTGDSGTLAVGTPSWSTSISLDPGDNLITVTGTNGYGFAVNDSVTITRALTIPLGLPVPTGINPETLVDWAPGDKYYLMFVTSTKTNATSTDIADYDAFVNAAADGSTIASVPDAVWYALASTAAVDARDRPPINGDFDPMTHPVYMMEDTVEGDPGSSVTLRKVFDNEGDMWDGSNDGSGESQLVYPYSYGFVDYDESGGGVRSPHGGEQVWTGTQNNGTEYSSGGLGTATPRQGQTNSDGEYWIGRNNIANNTEYHLYAISQTLEIPEPPPAGTILMFR